MKNAGIILCFIFICCGEWTYSQSNSFTPEWAYGINGGVTFSKVSFNSYISIPQVLLRQYSGGITLRYISESHFGLQMELNYSQRGWKERVDTIHVNRYARSLTYLELPLLTHIYFSLGKSARMFFNLGPQVGYYIGAKQLEREITDPQQNTDYYDIAIQHPFDYGLKGSLGIEFRTKSGSILLEGGYYFGLSDIFNNTQTDIFQASHNQVIGVNISYLLRRGSKKP